jgi:hypothetical protein
MSHGFILTQKKEQKVSGCNLELNKSFYLPSKFREHTDAHA